MGSRKNKSKSFSEQLKGLFSSNKAKADNPNKSDDPGYGGYKMRDSSKESISDKIGWTKSSKKKKNKK